MSRQSQTRLRLHNCVHPQSILWCLSHFCCCLHRSLTFTIFCQTDPYSLKSVKVTLCFSKFTGLWAAAEQSRTAADCRQRWIAGGSSLTKVDLSFLIWKKLNFVLYGKLHMLNIPVRLGGNYHDLHEAHSSVSLNHSWAVTEKNIPGKLTETQRIQPVYPNEIPMLWQLEGNLHCRQNRTAVIHQCGHRRVHHYWDVWLSKLPFLPVLNFGNMLCPTMTTYPHFQPLSNVKTMDGGLFSPAC